MTAGMRAPIGLGGPRGILLRLALVMAVAAALFPAQSGRAAAATVLDVRATWGDTYLPPGGEGQFALQAYNLGATAASDEITIVDDLPEGVTISSFGGDLGGVCSGVGTDVATCTIPAFLAGFAAPGRGSTNALLTVTPSGYFLGRTPIIVNVAIDPAASGSGTNTVTIAGGGSAQPASDVDTVRFSASPAPFGFVDGSFKGELLDAPYPFGAPARQAGSHPFELRVEFDLNQETGIDDQGPFADGNRYTRPKERVKDVEVTLPRGFVGNPEATPKCRPADFAAKGAVENSTGCPPDTQVGYLDIEFSNGKNAYGYGGTLSWDLLSRVALYSVEPPKGRPADFAFKAGGLVQGHIYPMLDPAHGYAIESISPDISSLVAVRGVRVTLWGVPADAAHDAFRYFPAVGAEPALGAPFGSAPVRPLLSLPMDCGFDNGGMLYRADSYTHPGAYTPLRETANRLNVGGCDDPRVRFDPAVDLQPTSRAAGGPTGLRVNLEVPQRDDTVDDPQLLYAQNGDVQAISTPPLKKAVVTLPEGMTISTSAAGGLGSCSPEQLGLGTSDPVTCPDSSQYGTLTLKTPILPKDAPMTGKIYVAKQNDNPFHNFLSLYFVVEDPGRGLLVKIPGKVDLDPVTGQITTTFDDLPQFPVSDMELSLKGGVRAALVNPSTCGAKTIAATFYSWADPNTPVRRSSSYQVTQKPDGSPCVNDLRDRPFAPQMTAGTVNPAAGAYSPFVYRVTRADEDQELDGLDVKLPKGLLAKIAGLAKCSDAAIGQAEAPGRTGTEEREHPSCPAASEIGSTEVGSGVGQVLTYVPGKAYLAGPYKGAPLSMVVITPVLAGPYDLGVIAVRSRIDVDRISTQATVTTDPFPRIFKGVPVRIRDVRVKVDRPQTTLNPTNCAAAEVASHLGSTLGARADLSVRFQAADCAALPFKPSLRFRLKGGTHRGDYPAFTATLRARPGDANIARTAVTLPHSEFLAQEHIRTVCTRVQYAQDACPKGSVYGFARATSPLFDGALQGPVYLRSSSHRLPDLVAKLDGEVDVELSGRIDSVRQGIRNTFDVIPDAPVSTFTLRMQGGKKGLLVNSRNLCKGVNRANVVMRGQNGKRLNARPVVASSCKRKARKASRHHKHVNRKRDGKVGR